MNNLMKNLKVDDEELEERSDTEQGEAPEEVRPDVDVTSPRPRTSSPLCPGAPARRIQSRRSRERITHSPLSSPIGIRIPEQPPLSQQQRELMDGLDGCMEALLPRRRLFNVTGNKK